MSASIRFLRHAESAANAGLRTPINSEIPLTDLGRQQALDFAAAMVAPPGQIFVSPFRRARDTAVPIQTRFAATPCIVREHLHEFVYLSPRIFDGTTAADRSVHVERYWSGSDPDYCSGDDAESFRAFMERVQRELDFLVQAGDANVLVVSHGQFIHMARLLVDDPSMSAETLMQRFMPTWRENPIPNTGIVEIHICFESPAGI